ncbi:hypothetical protein EVAR_94433_1 [Eumeta japonica]|uniref:Uncharacterized protein n=1 Tax=Eumeta variegata TaxID=151549 RepID=A0A4C1TQ42_EUMVA|nr:hypothetical protein EVAR_94433_1 [Eumeta japonica]
MVLRRCVCDDYQTLLASLSTSSRRPRTSPWPCVGDDLVRTPGRLNPHRAGVEDSGSRFSVRNKRLWEGVFQTRVLSVVMFTPSPRHTSQSPRDSISYPPLSRSWFVHVYIRLLRLFYRIDLRPELKKGIGESRVRLLIKQNSFEENNSYLLSVTGRTIRGCRHSDARRADFRVRCGACELSRTFWRLLLNKPNMQSGDPRQERIFLSIHIDDAMDI